MRQLLTAIAFVVVSSSAAAEEPGTDTPYRNFYKQLAPATQADTEHALRIRLCPKPLHKGEQLPANLAFEIRDGAERFPIAFDAQHCFELPANASWAEHDAVLHKNANMKLQAVVDITGQLPASTHLSYAQLTASVPAFERVIASQGMLARMFAPSVKGLEIKFDASSPQSLVVHAAEGDRKFTTDAKGEIHIRVDPKLNDATVELSSLPLEIGPDV